MPFPLAMNKTIGRAEALKNLGERLSVRPRLLLGPGPANCPSDVLKSMALPMMTHLHPEFLKIMEEVKCGLKYLFQTKSPYVFCISGTGHSAIESIMVNFLEEDDVVLIANNGIWGERAANIAKRGGSADVREVSAQPGEAFSTVELDTALGIHKPKVLFIVQGESSTGVLQDIRGISEICHRHGSLLAVDTVASLGGVPFFMDDWHVDVAYTGTQKVLNGPPSLSPAAISQKALYHHTGMVSSVYALREALAVLVIEGLEVSWKRHQECASALQRGIKSLGLQLFVSDEVKRLPTITTVKIPRGVDGGKVAKYIMDNCNIEIGCGLGPTAGKAWRIGLMGMNSCLGNVVKVIQAFEEALRQDKLMSHL